MWHICSQTITSLKAKKAARKHQKLNLKLQRLEALREAEERRLEMLSITGGNAVPFTTPFDRAPSWSSWYEMELESGKR